MSRNDAIAPFLNAVLKSLSLLLHCGHSSSSVSTLNV